MLLLRRKGIVTIKSNINRRTPQLSTMLSSPVKKDNFMIIEFGENDKNISIKLQLFKMLTLTGNVH